MRTLSRLALALSLLIAPQAHAQNSLTCSQSGTLVTFTNGIVTNKKDAESYIYDNIQFFLPSTEIDKQGKVEYKLIYNYSANFSLDMYESIRQKIADYYKISLVQAALKYTGVILNFTSIDSQLGDQLAELIIYKTAPYNLANDPIYQDTLKQHINTWKSAFVNHQKIIAISHSQGGFFLNDAYNKMMAEPGRNPKERNWLVMLQVATPAGFIAAHDTNGNLMGNYLTNDHDFIQLVPDALSANVELGSIQYILNFFDDKLAHLFETTYLKYFTPELKDKLRKVALMLKSNCSCTGWDGAPEPTYTYTNPDGSVGGTISVHAWIDSQSYNYIGKDVLICGGTSISNVDLRGHIEIAPLSTTQTDGTTFVYNIYLYDVRMFTEDSGSIYLTGNWFLYNTSVLALDKAHIELNNLAPQGALAPNTGNIYDSSIIGGNINLTDTYVQYITINGDLTLSNRVIYNCDITNGIYSGDYCQNVPLE